MSYTIVCPICGYYDRVEKVSAIVKSQTRNRERTEWRKSTYVDKSGKEQSFSYPLSYDVIESTDLAKSLSPPQQPQEPHQGGIFDNRGSCIGCISVSWILLWIWGVFAGNEYSSDVVFQVSLLILLGVIGIIFSVSLYKKDSDTDKRRITQYEADVPLWERAMHRWDQTYYCGRDDIVFIPNGKWVSSSQMEILIYESEMS